MTTEQTAQQLELAAQKPTPTFQLPPPPPGMQWHREDDWEEEDLPQGWRPLASGEQVVVLNDECLFYTRTASIWGPVTQPDTRGDRFFIRTRRPLTFTHEGKQWTWHRPGDPMPCDRERRVEIVMRSLEIGGRNRAGQYEWGIITELQDAEIIGWRYADEKKTVPLGPEDVPPGSVLRHIEQRNPWSSILWIDSEEGMSTETDLYSWEEAQYLLEINRSIPLTGRWNPDAWEPCHKIVSKNG